MREKAKKGPQSKSTVAKCNERVSGIMARRNLRKKRKKDASGDGRGRKVQERGVRKEREKRSVDEAGKKKS